MMFLLIFISLFCSWFFCGESELPKSRKKNSEVEKILFSNIYIHIKFLHQICMRKIERECAKKTSNLYLFDSENMLKHILQINVDTASKDLRHEKDLVTSKKVKKFKEYSLSIVSEYPKKIELITIMTTTTQIYDTIVQFGDEDFKTLIEARIRILEKIKSTMHYFVLRYIFENKNTRNTYIEKIKYFQTLSNIQWKNLLRYNSITDKLFYCVPDILDYEDYNSICNKDMIHNFPLTFRGIRIDDEHEILKNYYYKLHIEEDVILLAKNQNEPIELSIDYEDVTTNLCSNIYCYNNAQCKQKKNSNYIYEDCFCRPGFIGTLCENIVQCSYCFEGQCDVDGKCSKCRRGWEGEYCEIRSCSNLKVCNGNGICQSTNTKRKCICDDEFVGRYCSISCRTRDICPRGQFCLIHNNQIKCTKTKPTTTVKPIFDPNIIPGVVKPPYLKPDSSKPKNPKNIPGLLPTTIYPDIDDPDNKYAGAMNGIKIMGITSGVITTLVVIATPLLMSIFITCCNCGKKSRPLHQKLEDKYDNNNNYQQYLRNNPEALEEMENPYQRQLAYPRYANQRYR